MRIWPNWLLRWFGDRSCAPETPNPPPASPELSCFVKGLIRSINETPGEWEKWCSTDDDKDFHCIFSCRGVDIHYADEKVSVYIKDGGLRTRERLTAVEYRALSTTIETQLFRPFVETVRQRRADKAAQKVFIIARNRAPFEKLGCPDNTQSP